MLRIKNLSSKHGEEFLGTTKKWVTDALKTTSKEFLKKQKRKLMIYQERNCWQKTKAASWKLSSKSTASTTLAQPDEKILRETCTPLGKQ